MVRVQGRSGSSLLGLRTERTSCHAVLPGPELAGSLGWTLGALNRPGLVGDSGVSAATGLGYRGVVTEGVIFVLSGGAERSN